MTLKFFTDHERSDKCCVEVKVNKNKKSQEAVNIYINIDSLKIDREKWKQMIAEAIKKSIIR